MITVIFPTHNEEDNVQELHRRIIAVLSSIQESYEIIAVDDSSDKTRERLLELRPIKVISLAYQIGQTAAIDAGIRNAKGDVVVMLDADLQNDPADIPLLLAKLREGYDAVLGWRRERTDSFRRRIFSLFANKVTNLISGLSFHDYGCALRVFRREQLENIHLYGVMHVFLPVILSYRNAKIAEIRVAHHARKAGTTKYTFRYIASDIADLLAIKFLYGYAARPLVFFGGWALWSWLIATLAVLASVAIKWKGILGLSQTPLPIFASLLVILGFLLFILGFITELLIRIYYEAKHETPYKISAIVENK